MLLNAKNAYSGLSLSVAANEQALSSDGKKLSDADLGEAGFLSHMVFCPPLSQEKAGDGVALVVLANKLDRADRRQVTASAGQGLAKVRHV